MQLNPEGCENEDQLLKITRKKGTSRKFVSFQVLPDSVHQAKFERYQDHIKLDDQNQYHGAHGRLTYDFYEEKRYHTLDSIIHQTKKLT